MSIEFGSNLKRIRADSGMTMDALCDEYNRRYGTRLNRSTLCRYEAGRQEPTITTVKQMAEMLGRPVSELIGSADKKISDSFVRVPVVGLCHAGIPAEEIREVDDFEDVSETIVGGGVVYALRVSGSSMSPTLLDGDIVIVKQQPTADSGEVIVARLNGEATLKRLKLQEGEVILVPDNLAEFAPIFVKRGDNFRILGKVVELRRKRI